MKMERNNKKEKINQVADKNFQPEDYQQNSELSEGLALTHEQVNDTLTEGTVDGEIDDFQQMPKK